jgi:hypothetical protein
MFLELTGGFLCLFLSAAALILLVLAAVACVGFAAIVPIDDSSAYLFPSTTPISSVLPDSEANGCGRPGPAPPQNFGWNCRAKVYASSFSIE